ncbi:MAG: MFS transporter [Candidatus Bathyarchaeota archaeon]|nr:MFS transporter [Candidatus Bathyarchaeota archaeon]
MEITQTPQDFSPDQTAQPQRTGILAKVVPENVNLNAKYFLVGGFSNGISNGVFNAVLQLYLLSLGFGSQNLGTIFMMNALSSTILTIPAGILADRYGKKKIILAGAVTVLLSMVVFFVSQSVTMFALSFLLIGVCNATGTVLTPLYSSFFNEDDMDKAFGLWGLLNISAMSLGSLAGYIPPMMVTGLGLTLTTAYRYTMMMAATLFVAQYFFYFKASDGLTETLSSEFSFNLKSKSIVLKICILTLLTNVAGGIMFSLFPYYVNQKYGVESAALGTMFFGANLAMALSKGAAASFAKKLGGLKSITLGIALSGIFFLLMPVSPTFAVLSVFFVLRMGTRFMSDPLVTSIFMRSISDDEKSTANSLRMIAMNGGGIVSPLLGGTLMEKVGLDSPAIIGGIATLMLAAMFPLLLRNEAKKLETNGE